jgi:hypothetical protein
MDVKKKKKKKKNARGTFRISQDAHGPYFFGPNEYVASRGMGSARSAAETTRQTSVPSGGDRRGERLSTPPQVGEGKGGPLRSRR